MANDYVGKPVEPRERVARIGAVLRTGSPVAPDAAEPTASTLGGAA